MRALIIGGNGYIGSQLKGALENIFWEVTATYREDYDLLNLPSVQPDIDVVYICAAMTRFIECEDDARAYRINVDAPINIAKAYPQAKIIYLSSEAVERAIHTAYGMHKALAEIGLRTVCEPVIVRLSKVEPHKLAECCTYLASLSDHRPGVYHWP